MVFCCADSMFRERDFITLQRRMHTPIHPQILLFIYSRERIPPPHTIFSLFFGENVWRGSKSYTITRKEGEIEKLTNNSKIE